MPIAAVNKARDSEQQAMSFFAARCTAAKVIVRCDRTLLESLC